MRMKSPLSVVARLAALALCLLPAWAAAQPAFDVLVLGATGGIQDGNLSSFFIRPAGDARGVACDAGSVVNGLKVADERGALADITVPEASRHSRIGHVLTQQLKGYLISHAHLDHVLGLVIASPDDSAKPVYALASVNAELSASLFNWSAWPNMADRGKPPQLKKYTLQDLVPGTVTPLRDTALQVTAFPLSHAGVESTAFLIEQGDNALLCLGDTGPDAVEGGERLTALWTAVAERVRQRRLKALIVEVSYGNDRPDKQLYGHLTPAWLLASLRTLARLAGPDALQGLPVVVSHIKYALLRDEPPQQQIARELAAGNDLGLRFIIPQQGDRLRF